MADSATPTSVAPHDAQKQTAARHLALLQLRRKIQQRAKGHETPPELDEAIEQNLGGPPTKADVELVARSLSRRADQRREQDVSRLQLRRRPVARTPVRRARQRQAGGSSVRARGSRRGRATCASSSSGSRGGDPPGGEPPGKPPRYRGASS